jgi:hypothetical protein
LLAETESDPTAIDRGGAKRGETRSTQPATWLPIDFSVKVATARPLPPPPDSAGPIAAIQLYNTVCDKTAFNV